MSWASRRKSQYAFGLLLFLGLITLAIAYPILNKKPTCFDGKQNGAERGVDCGGVCQRVCNADVAEPVILWRRAFPVTGSIYNLVALIENQNKGAAIKEVNYEFRIYDDKNLLIGRREGTTYIPPNQQFVVFEPRFDAGTSVIKSVAFDFTTEFVWVKKDSQIALLPIRVANIILNDDKKNPILSAQVVNDSIYDLPEFDVIALLYDIDRNVINVSKTQTNGLASNSSSAIIFTWPQPLFDNPVTRDILVQINPFSVEF